LVALAYRQVSGLKFCALAYTPPPVSRFQSITDNTADSDTAQGVASIGREGSFRWRIEMERATALSSGNVFPKVFELNCCFFALAGEATVFDSANVGRGSDLHR